MIKKTNVHNMDIENKKGKFLCSVMDINDTNNLRRTEKYTALQGIVIQPQALYDVYHQRKEKICTVTKDKQTFPFSSGPRWLDMPGM